MTLRTQRDAEPPSLVSEAVLEAAAGLPYYLANLAVALLLLTLALAAYTLVAGRADLVRARLGDIPATISVSGVLLGFALPIASVVASASSLLDLLLRAAAALAVQLVAVLVWRRVLRAAATRDKAASDPGGVLQGALAVTLGLINAAAVAL